MNRVQKIYVILPTFNNESTIERAIMSVLNQDYDGELDLIVVPNGCTDNTFGIYEKTRFSYYKAENRKRKISIESAFTEEKGVVNAFNVGLDDAAIRYGGYDNIIPNKKTTWICRMDGDDAWYPDKIRKQVAFINANPDIDVVGGQMKYVSPNGYHQLGFTSNPLEHDAIFKNMMNGSNVVPNPAAIYRWGVMDKAGRLEDIFPYAEDYWFWLKVLLTGHKFANLPDVLMDYTYERKPHENPAIGQSVAQVAQFIYGYNQTFKKKW